MTDTMLEKIAAAYLQGATAGIMATLSGESTEVMSARLEAEALALAAGILSEISDNG